MVEQILGKAMNSNFGKILAGSLESSNTNISMEMVNLIKTQQAFMEMLEFFKVTSKLTEDLWVNKFI